MKKALCSFAVLVMLLASCNTAKKEAAQAQESQIRQIDSLVTQIDSLKTDIDSSMKEVDDLINDL